MEACKCWNCKWAGPIDAALEIKDFWSRVSPGEVMPAGECPECGALAHIEQEKPKVVIEVCGGVAEVTSCSDGIDVQVINHDNGKEG